MDCAAGLTELYLLLGRYDKAHEEYLYMVSSPASIMSSLEPHVWVMWSCRIPHLVLDVLLNQENITMGAAKYAALQVINYMLPFKFALLKFFYNCQ